MSMLHHTTQVIDYIIVRQQHVNTSKKLESADRRTCYKVRPNMPRSGTQGPAFPCKQLLSNRDFSNPFLQSMQLML